MRTPPIKRQVVANRLLAALPPDEHDLLRPALEVVRQAVGDVLYEPGESLRFVHFPSRGVLTILVCMKDGRTAEAGIVGSEGMVCLDTFLGCDTAPFRVVAQNPGEALRMKADDFKAALCRSEALRRLLHRYLDAFLCMVSQSAACKALHPLEQRCARWLLMTQDRVGPDHFLLTQESLAHRLGVLRTSISEVAHTLQASGLIHYSRGKITVRDRPGLEAVACECYGKIRAKFDALPRHYQTASLGGDWGFGRSLEKLPVAAYTCDIAGRITSFNRRAVELWGREPRLNDAVDRYCGSFKLFSPEGCPMRHDQCWMALALREGKEYAGREVVIERPDGSRRTALAHATPLHDEWGHICAGVNVLIDIGGRKRVEE